MGQQGAAGLSLPGCTCLGFMCDPCLSACVCLCHIPSPGLAPTVPGPEQAPVWRCDPDCRRPLLKTHSHVLLCVHRIVQTSPPVPAPCLPHSHPCPAPPSALPAVSVSICLCLVVLVACLLIPPHPDPPWLHPLSPAAPAMGPRVCAHPKLCLTVSPLLCVSDGDAVSLGGAG